MGGKERKIDVSSENDFLVQFFRKQEILILILRESNLHESMDHERKKRNEINLL